MVSLSTTSFAVFTSLSGYLASRCLTPPNPNPNPGSSQAWGKDSIRLLASHPAAILTGRLISSGFCLHHALVALLLDGEASPQHGHLNLDLFRWSWATSLGLVSIFLGAALRLAAFGALGSRFTFGLAKPSELNTRGIYAYIQHPSYTGMVLLLAPVQLLFVRWDASPAYWLSRSTVETLRGWGVPCCVGLFASAIISLGLRVSEEEAMLKDVFGKKWVTWHKKTKRFIPGLF
ncbi:hypothetical protein E4U41_006418 [Claviceps citrina]|nr:hypothetical protein E4U41_006418 [Claviceps citrina]